MENEKEMREALEGASFQMWQAYCNKKMECEDLSELAETQAARIAELEAQVKQLQRVPLSAADINAIWEEYGLDTDGALHFARAREAAHNIK